MLDEREKNMFMDLLGLSWFTALEKTLHSEEFRYLGKFLEYEREKYVIYPAEIATAFRAFTLTPLSDVRVVILGQDPYHDGRYDGLAFSNGGQKHPSPSLLNILVEIETQIYKNEKDLLQPIYYDLARWSEQGVLLLNTALSVRKGQALTHTEEWAFFTAEVMSALNRHHTGLVYLLWGRHAKSYAKYIDKERNHILTCGHPVTKAYGHDLWSKNGHFSQTNELLLGMNNTKITW